jgi:hypothetical protein
MSNVMVSPYVMNALADRPECDTKERQEVFHGV